MKKMALFFLEVLLAVSCTHTQIQKPEALQISNPSGIALTCKKAYCVDTPNGGPVAYYLLNASRVPPNRKFCLQSTDELHPRQSPLELVSDEFGQLHLASEKGVLLKEYPLCMTWRQLGERADFWLVSEDKKIVVQTSSVPYPLEAFGTDGAQISLVKITPNGSLVKCKGQHFLLEEKLMLQSVTKNKTASQPIVTYDGTFFIELEPPDPKSYGDIVTLQLIRQNGECISLTYPWGREAFNKDLYACNPSKFKEEDYEKLQEAYKTYWQMKMGKSDLS